MRLTDPWLLLRAWLLAPLLIGLGSLGLGNLVASAAGMRLRALTAPVGFLGGIAVVTLALQIRVLVGEPAVIVLAVVAVAGLVVGFQRLEDPRSLLWPSAAAIVAYAVFLAPLAGSGRSGIVGYVLNNDPAVHLASIELIRDHGPVGYHSLQDSYHYVSGNFGVGYPVGSYVWPLFARVLAGTDPFHLWTPVIAVAGAMLALTASAVLRQLDAPRSLAAGAAVMVAGGYLTYSYAAQGGEKEVIASVGVYTAIAAFAAAHERGYDWRGLIPAVVCVAGGIGVFGLAELAWLGPAGLMALGLAVAARRSAAPAGRIARDLVLAAALFAALTLPGLVAGQRFIAKSSTEVLNDVGESGNLVAPLHWFEAFGVWLNKDYRYPTTDSDLLTGIGIAVAAVLAVVGLFMSVRRRRPAVAMAVVAGFAAVFLIVARGRHGIYIDAKAYALLAPALGLAAAAGVVALWTTRRRAARVLGVVLGGLLAIGGIASDAMVYSGAWVTPKDRFAELFDLDARYAGQGPVLVNEREEYAKYLLRHVGPWMSWDSYQPDRGFVAGAAPPAIPHVPDFDDYRPEFMQRFPLLFERKRPGGSRPPGNYTVVAQTRHYRVWRRVGPPPRAHLALGNGDTLSGVARLDCRAPEFVRLRRLAVRAGEPLRISHGLRLHVRYDYEWKSSRPVVPGPQANFNYRIDDYSEVPAFLPAGRWDAWIEGSFGPGKRLSFWPKGRGVGVPIKVGEVRSDLGLHDGFQYAGAVTVAGGSEAFDLLSLERPWWLSGSRRPDLVGPIVFTPADAGPRVTSVAPQDAGRLCGKRLDWVEVP